MALPDRSDAQYAPAMSGYAASARVVRASPRVLRHEAFAVAADWRPSELGPVVVDDGRIVRTEPATSFDERWGRFRDRWAQLTFFLGDPNSWR